MQKMALLFLMTLCGAPPLGALPIEVTTNLDVQDASLAATIDDLINGDVGPDGLISLREAIQAANISEGQDTIYFSPAVTAPILLGTGGSESLLLLSDNTGGTIIAGRGIVLDGSGLSGMADGLRITSGENTILGLTIVRFANAGISLSSAEASGNVIWGCHIGILNGAAAPNRYGVEIRSGAHNNVIGGGSGEVRNVISGNREVGIFIYGAGSDSNSIVGCYIGTDETGTVAVPNEWNGITIGYGASQNVVGGALAEMCNVISGNGRSGVFLYEEASANSRNAIFGNYIGVAADGQAPLPNGFWGVYIGNGSSANVIGDIQEGWGNVIRHNGRDGVEVNGAGSWRNMIRGNSIHNNTDLAIDLVGGANDGVQAPVITSVYPISGTTQTPNGLVDFYADVANEGKEYVGTITADASGDFVADLDLAAYVGKNLTAAVTDGLGNTSMLSAPVAIPEAGEGEGEGEPTTQRVTVEITQADDICRVYLNGETVLQTAWGEGPGGTDIGDQPGNSGPVDVTALLRTGLNTFRFVVYNEANCCGVSGFFEVKVNGERVYFDGISEEDSTAGVKFFDTFVLDWDPSRADLIVRVFELGTQAVLPQAVVRIEPTGETARIGEDGYHRFLLAMPGTYRAIVTAVNYRTAESEPLVLAGVSAYATLSFWLDRNDAGAQDSDGDGLPDAEETDTYGTNPNSADSDGDGMSDLFEVQHGLNNALNDAQEDPDGDGFSNLREFQLRSDPNDPGSPRTDFHVSTSGDDANPGTAEAPWRTIQHAVDTVGDLIGDVVGQDVAAGLRLLADGTRATVLVAAGSYAGNIVLRPGIRLQGAALGQSVIQGQVETAPFSAIVSMRVQEPALGASPLITVDSGHVLLDRVGVVGRTNSQATGVLFSGNESRTVLVTDCVIAQVKTGMIIEDALPLVRRTRFSNIGDDAIVIKATSRKQDDENTFGQAGDSGSGWNRFENIGDKAIVNERATPITIENNDWDTDDSAEIASLVEGQVDYEPYLAKGSGLLPASIVCTVWDAATYDPVTNASAALAPGGFEEVTENVDGVYTFAAIPAGSYTVTVSTPNYDPVSKSVSVGGGETASLVFALGAQKSDPTDGCGCFKAAPGVSTPLSAQAGDILLGMLAAAMLIFWGRRG